MSETHTLRIWLAAPLQSWGTSSRFEVRGTDLAPSKSGVIGMLCAALGRTRGQSVDDLAALRFGVCVERRGTVLRDFHTVGAGTDPVITASGAKGRGIVTERLYLQDAAFVVGLEGTDVTLLTALGDALSAPRWPLALGRKSCPPAGPLVDGDSIVAVDLVPALTDGWRPVGVPSRLATVPARVELLLEDPGGELVTDDQPRGAAYEHRAFVVRRARSAWVQRAVA